MNIKPQQKILHTLRSICLIFSLCALTLSGCGQNKLPEKTGDIDYTIVTGSSIPKELQTLIDERKKEAFELTFSDDAFLYIIKGYGKQKSGGYSIKINQFYKAEDTMVLDTDLLGPKQEEEVSRKPSYPYIVLKIEFREEPVTFY